LAASSCAAATTSSRANPAATSGTHCRVTVRESASMRAVSAIVRAQNASMNARAAMLTVMSPSRRTASARAERQRLLGLVVDLAGDPDAGWGVLAADPQHRVRVVGRGRHRAGVERGHRRQRDRVEPVPVVLAQHRSCGVGQRRRETLLELLQLLAVPLVQ
jgi:hypothetical protein